MSLILRRVDGVKPKTKTRATAATVVLCLALSLGAASPVKAQTVRPPCPGGNVYIQNGVWACTAPASGHTGAYIAAGAAAAVVTAVLIRHYHHHHDEAATAPTTPPPGPTACSDAEPKSNRCWWSTGR